MVVGSVVVDECFRVSSRVVHGLWLLTPGVMVVGDVRVYRCSLRSLCSLSITA
jgi:hypothetical protein